VSEGERERERRIGAGTGDYADPHEWGDLDVDSHFFGTERGPHEIHGAMRRKTGLDPDLPAQPRAGWPDVSGLREQIGLD
jgi:hypothetical protein